MHQLALVTGATSGIGRAICKLLASHRLELIALGRNQEELRQLEQALSRQVLIQTLPVDLNRPEGREELIALLHQRVPDLVINNAGFGLYGEALTYSTEEQVAILEVNAKAVLEITLEAARAWVSKARQGIILNVSSVAAFQVFPNMAVYAASKAFVNHFSEAMDFEMRPYGIRVLTLCPGMVATAFQKRAGGESLKQKESKGVMSPEFVAEQMWEQIMKGQRLKIIDWRYRLLLSLSHLFPTSWLAPMQGKWIAERISPRNLRKIGEKET